MITPLCLKSGNNKTNNRSEDQIDQIENHIDHWMVNVTWLDVEQGGSWAVDSGVHVMSARWFMLPLLITSFNSMHTVNLHLDYDTHV